MIRFFVKNNNFVMLVLGDSSDGRSFNLLNVIKGSLSYFNIKNGDYIIDVNSIVKKVYPQKDTLNKLRDRIALFATTLINSGYTELRKFKELKEVPLDKKSKHNKKFDYIKKRLKKI